MKSIIESISNSSKMRAVNYSGEEGTILGKPFKFKDFDKYADKYERDAYSKYKKYPNIGKEDLEYDIEPEDEVCLFITDDGDLSWYLFGSDAGVELI